MSQIIDIDRLSITLHGVSEEIARAAAGGLDEAIRRRLGGRRIATAGTIPEVRLDPLDLPARADAHTLRELLADRVIGAIDGANAGRPPRGEPR